MIKIYSGDGRHPMKLGLEISAWLKQQGLQPDRDYTWTVDTRRNHVILAFVYTVTEKQMGTAIKLRWSQPWS